MKITILQRNIEWANPVLNVQRADEAIDRNPGSDLYVLPEMFRPVSVQIRKALPKVPKAIPSNG